MNINELIKVLKKNFENAINGMTYDRNNNTLEIHNESGTVDRVVAWEELPKEVQKNIDDKPQLITM